jgi:hypothetical protein
MKGMRKISVILLMLLTAVSLSLNAQRGMRGMRADTAGMKMQKMGQMRMHMHGKIQDPDSSQIGRMRRGMGPMSMNNMFPMRPMHNMPGLIPGGPHQRMGMWRQPRMMFPGMNPAPGMWRSVMGMRILENIPNLTDKQEKEIADLRQKQQDEMQKFRSDMQAKMQEMRESHRAKLRDLLNDEQKKWFDENSPGPREK